MYIIYTIHAGEQQIAKQNKNNSNLFIIFCFFIDVIRVNRQFYIYNMDVGVYVR